MDAIQRWVARLRGAAPQRVRPYVRRVSVPGTIPLELTDCFVAAAPIDAVAESVRAHIPTSISELRYLDEDGMQASIPEPQALSAALGALLTLALGRRVEVLNELPIGIPQLGTRLFMPLGHVLDKDALGPLPLDGCSRIEEYLRLAAGLNEKDARIIGAAAGMYHGALLIFDKDLSAAYTLLVAGAEVLSRQYGDPPSRWSDWEEHGSWETFFEQHELTDDQASALRGKLLTNRHLRLRATFKAYAAMRLPDQFWSKRLVDWTYGINANNDSWIQAAADKSYQIRDVMTADRVELSKALGLSYDLRSGVVHSGRDVPFFEQLVFGDSLMAADRPLPFFLMRHVLSELINVELRARSSSAELPDMKVM